MSEIYVGTLLFLYAGSMVCAYFYDITREKHSQNLQTLAERRLKLAATVSPTGINPA